MFIISYYRTFKVHKFISSYLKMNQMEISARNILKGKVESVEKGQVMASIKINVTDPTTITAVITKESAEKLNIKEGDDLAAIIKSTEVIVGKE